MKSLEAIVLSDAKADQVRRNHAEAIKELQSVPLASAVVIKERTLANATDTPIAHPLGRAPSFVTVSVPRGPSSSGRVEEIRSSSYDRAKTVVLRATGWGATITVDVLVIP